jgi:hypothetical protein
LSNSNNNSISKSRLLSYGVFGFSISIILLCCVSVIFPALITNTNSEFSEFPFYSQQVDSFEIGVLAIPFVILNTIVLLIGIIYYKKHYSLNRLFDFDVSKKVAIISIAIILSAYIITTIPEFEKDEEFADYIKVETRLNESIHENRFTFEDAISGNPNYSSIEPHVKYSLLIISEKIFGDFRVIAFIASIALLIATFAITQEITKKRIPGILAMLLVLQSNTFLSYDTSAAYSNFWILFYLLSLYLVIKKWQFTHISFVLSIFSKLISTVFLPLTIFFVLNNTKGKKRMYILIFYAVLIIIALIFVSNSNILTEDKITYLPENFVEGFTQFTYQLRFDPIILIFLLPLTVTLFLKSLKGFQQANSIQILIAGFLLIPPLLITFSQQTNEPYRLIPLVVFFAIGVSVLLTKIKQDEPLSK